MPELPEVEVLVRHLHPILRNRTIRSITVVRPKVTRPNTTAQMERALIGCSFTNLQRRGKYLVFSLRQRRSSKPIHLLGHLGMTGRIYLQKRNLPVPRHSTVVLGLGALDLIFEDTRVFGRVTLDLTALDKLGPEPLSPGFNPADFAVALQKSAQPVKLKLLDQTIVAGIGNIYASEALFLARIAPTLPARNLNPKQIQALTSAIRRVLRVAISRGSTIPLDWSGTGPRDGLFYYGRPDQTQAACEERLRVYDRAGRPCLRCQTSIHRITQASRSTYFCPNCQPQILC
jgi:formamidopyrimidine-DNA glycosylase